ncbi:MAG TPA: hypothetical protein VL132_00540 [Planctomycetaceae bacterium]|nr:hypothetical protein [Planctomycetaceae bacterium]
MNGFEKTQNRSCVKLSTTLPILSTILQTTVKPDIKIGKDDAPTSQEYLKAITPTYAIVAALVGLYLGGLLEFCQPSNLTIPILVHSFYDWLAFLIVRQSCAKRSTEARDGGD